MLKSLKHKLRLANQLSRSDWLIFFEAWRSLLGFWLALRLKSFDALFKARSLPSKKKPTLPNLIPRLHQLIGWASHLHILPMTCLPKSLTLHRMLTRRGIDSQIKIGANKTSLGISAHAWVEVDGEAIGESETTIASFNVLDAGEKTGSF